jgi:hypothetical protein
MRDHLKKLGGSWLYVVVLVGTETRCDDLIWCCFTVTVGPRYLILTGLERLP